jgi:enoyl-CoA hydratase/carnithine racemase
MDNVIIENHKRITVIRLNKGKVHPLNEEMVDTIRTAFESVEHDDDVSALIFTGTGSFFSFGLDVPELYHYDKKDFARFIKKFTDLYTYLFTYPKPIVAAINGHAIAGGCMLATACDYRIMVSGKARISLNEVTFGSSVFAGSVEMLKYIVGGRHAEEVLFPGKMFSAEEAHRMGLIDRISTDTDIMSHAMTMAEEFAARDGVAFTSIKGLLRNPVAERMKRLEPASLEEFNNIWYSPSTREKLKAIQIRK